MRPIGTVRSSCIVLLIMVLVPVLTPVTGCTAFRPGRGSGAAGPLRAHPRNPRYFADGAGRVVYLTGSHTWNNFKDMGQTDPPPLFDFDAYLDFMKSYNHNFMRLWTWDLTVFSYEEDGILTYVAPFPWKRTGPGTGLDGKPKFDLKQFDSSYFDRLRSRITAAGKRGIYVSIMLFEGHGLHASQPPWCWDSHPFNRNNNVNGIDGDTNADGRGLEIQTLEIPDVTALQEAYIRRVIDTVNDLDNVLYEIVNESGVYSTEWQYHIINYIHDYERSKPKQHPVGMTFQYTRDKNQRGTNTILFGSPADWISPNPDGGYRDDPPPCDGGKVILNDTDHLWGIGGNQAWVWKSFCRGLNPLFMDPYRETPQKDQTNSVWTDHLTNLPPVDSAWDPVRRSMGYTMTYAGRMNLVSMVPCSDLASTGYCLADPGAEYLVYLPDGGSVTMDMKSVSGTFTVEWFNPSTGRAESGENIPGGDMRECKAPFSGDAVLYLRKK
ncbi:DUF6298 domain-containing protein [bacterium]|nr:DUF6298 domain-containing protein [bacterium]